MNFVPLPEKTEELRRRTAGRIEGCVIGSNGPQGINRHAKLDGVYDADDLREIADFLDEIEKE